MLGCVVGALATAAVSGVGATGGVLIRAVKLGTLPPVGFCSARCSTSGTVVVAAAGRVTEAASEAMHTGRAVIAAIGDILAGGEGVAEGDACTRAAALGTGGLGMPVARGGVTLSAPARAASRC